MARRSTGSVVSPPGDGHRHRPVVLCYAAPEDPNHHDRQQREERLEQRTVDFPIGALADVGADDEGKDLADCEEQSGGSEVYYL